jgi:hypothetical protein
MPWSNKNVNDFSTNILTVSGLKLKMVTKPTESIETTSSPVGLSPCHTQKLMEIEVSEGSHDHFGKLQGIEKL